MCKKKFLKITFVMACILTLIMPYTSQVLAAALTSNDVTADLQIVTYRQGGPESSGTLTNEQNSLYDQTPYGYKVGDTRVFKIITKGDNTYSNAFYCLNAKKTFPGQSNPGQDYLTYTNVADFKDSTDSNVKSLHLSTSNSADSAKWTANYKALVWLMDNMYLAKQAPEQKDAYLAKAFEGYQDWDLDVVKALLTDDDIDVVQQYAIWYFTNNDSSEFSETTLPSVRLSRFNLEEEGFPEEEGSYRDFTGNNYRYDMANYLYQYLIEAATEGKTEEVTYPSIANTETSSKTDDDNYVLGPFRVVSGTAPAAEYTIKLLDQNGKEIAREDYKIKIDGEEDFSSKNVNEILDKDYYIYLPKTNKSINKVSLSLHYSSHETEATLWENKTTDSNGVEVYQPVVLLIRKETPHDVNKDITLNKDEADLALRKYIVSVNGKTVNRKPTVDASELAKGTAETASYKHAKDPISVSVGDTIVYEIRVYNEADIDASGIIIVDSLPAGLELVENSEINKTYNWKVVSGEGENSTKYSSDYLQKETVNAFDKTNANSLEKNSKYVQIECRVSNGAKASSVLTNIAEISSDNIDDRDSTPNNNDYVKNDYDQSSYTGNKDNKSDLTDDNYFYQGREDDDDFEKVQVIGKVFDLSLQKFISKVNGTAVSPSRAPTVDVTNLKNGTSTDATYTTSKTPVSVEVGDIVEYTIRVYNEGEVAGYAEEVADYIPEGLGFLVEYNTNIDNNWSIPQDSKTVKLSTIKNGTKNVKKDDFTGIDKIEDASVVKGKAKLTSTKLKSSSTDTKNLIAAFDKENGTKLDYRDIKVVCVVLVDEVSNNNLKNIAEITNDSDENRDPVLDKDSTPDTVNPDNYPGDDKNQDDHDYENLTTKEPDKFDLSLQKFITKVNNTDITDRVPSVTKKSDGTYSVTAPSVDALAVENNDLITYTIRVYNEGNVDGYAQEIGDDIPKGLIFVTDNETNKKYEWKLYDKDGKVTTDVKQAVSVRTDYLSKEKSAARNEDSLIKAATESGATLDYKDVQIVFKVNESVAKSNEGRKIINTAEITDDADKDGNPVDDVDSTPNNNKDGEDDLDREQVYVKYFDLSLRKDLTKIIVSENGTTREISVSATDGLQKVEIHRNRLTSTTVKFVYTITVKNEGEIAGYATEISDYIPAGLEFIADENKQWTKVSDDKVTTNALANTRLEPGKEASVQLVLKWINGENNLGLKTNTAEISADKNDSNTPDIDSTPNNRIPDEDDIDTADVFLSISTGAAPTYIALTTTVLAILATGIILIKKFVL